MLKNTTLVLIAIAFFFANVVYATADSSLRIPMTATKRAREVIDKTSRASSVNPFLLFKEGNNRGNLTIDKKTIFIGMGGGDTAGLNDFVAYTVEKLTKMGYRVMGIKNGFKGFLRGISLEDNLIELTPEIVAGMKGLPSMALGSCREKLKAEDIAKIVDILKPSAGAVFIGGNDHLKNVEQVADEAGKQGVDITVVGVPKSIDNDFMTIMHGFQSAVVSGRQTAAIASINTERDGVSTAAVFECMGRKSGSLTLELSKGCPYSRVVIVPEKPVTIDDIINASNDGIRNFFVSEGFSLSEKDPKLNELLNAYPVLSAMWWKSRTNPDRDAHHNPKLTGASLFVKGILEHFCGLKVEKTELTYQLRGAFLKPDNQGVVFDTFLADKFSEEAAHLISTKQSGLALTYNLEYGDITGIVEAKAPSKVYTSRNLISTLLGKPETEMDKLSKEDQELVNKAFANLGILGVSDTKYNAISEPVVTGELSLEDAVREAFYGIAASTYAHQYASVAELQNNVISSCNLNQADIDKLSHDLKIVVEGTRDSVLVLVPEEPKSLSQIANSIKEICGRLGYINMAISKDFTLDPEDELLESVLNTDPVLRARFKEGIVDNNTGMIRFESGVSSFIVGLCKYLIKKSEIKVEGIRITDLGYAFKGLARGNVLDSINRVALDSGV